MCTRYHFIFICYIKIYKIKFDNKTTPRPLEKYGGYKREKEMTEGPEILQ